MAEKLNPWEARISKFTLIKQPLKKFALQVSCPIGKQKMTILAKPVTWQMKNLWLRFWMNGRLSGSNGLRLCDCQPPIVCLFGVWPRVHPDPKIRNIHSFMEQSKSYPTTFRRWHSVSQSWKSQYTRMADQLKQALRRSTDKSSPEKLIATVFWDQFRSLPTLGSSSERSHITTGPLSQMMQMPMKLKDSNSSGSAYLHHQVT